MEKLNIAEILRSCPQGMELDCTIFEDAIFEEVRICCSYPIKIITDGHAEFLTEYGCINYNDNAKCVIFPKGKTTWEGFQRPFKDGDVVTWKDRGSLVACIYKERKNTASFNHHIALYKGGLGIVVNGEIALTDGELCLATKEEQEKLFKVIKDNGYRWNLETKALEKLEVKKFDITTLKPFDKVLTRDNDKTYWSVDFYSHCLGKDKLYQFVCIGGMVIKQCIPYEENKCLLGKTDSCDEYFKTWE